MVTKSATLFDVQWGERWQADDNEELLARLRRYEEEEEDTELVECLRRCYVQEDGEEAAAVTVRGQQDPEPYEELPPHEEAFLRFQVISCNHLFRHGW